MLEAKALCCIRDERTLFDALNFVIKPNEIVQVEGPNGAGKTSLLRILAGLARPEKGEILWQGEPIRHCREVYHQALLYFGHQPGVKAALTAYENLAFYQSVTNAKNSEAVWQALAMVGLTGYEDVPVAQLSAGQQRRVALARLWLSKAALWILDEPLTAIDKSGVGQLFDLFEQHVQQGGMVILTSHQEVIGKSQSIRKISLRHGEAY